jgi:uncharacterized protein
MARFMIIDAHAHLYPHQGSVDPLLRAMDEQNVDLAIISAIVGPADGDGRAQHEVLAAAVRAHPDRLAALASVLPYRSDAPALLRHAIETYGFKGLKLHPSIQGFAPSDLRIQPLIVTAAELGLPVLFHSGAVPIPGTRSRYDDPLEIDDLALGCPGATLIIAHGEPLGTAPAIAAKHPNVYMDGTTSLARYARLIPGVIEDMLEFMGMVNGRRGSDKVLFGTDANPLKPYRVAENLLPLLTLRIPPEERELILAQNARRLFNL